MAHRCYAKDMSILLCLYCKVELTRRHQKKFCSNKCQANYQYEFFKTAWLSGHKKVVTKNISAHIKRYFIEASGEKCSSCQWGQVHLLTKRVPLEVDHIDGNAENNEVINLRLLCPNCHSLTPYFRNLNRGNGRAWRKNYST